MGGDDGGEGSEGGAGGSGGEGGDVGGEGGAGGGDGGGLNRMQPPSSIVARESKLTALSNLHPLIAYWHDALSSTVTSLA